MTRHDVLLILAGAGALLVLLTIFGFARALILRGRRKRHTAQAWRRPPPPDDSAIEAIRREADEGERRYRQRLADEERRRLEADWRRDGEISLTRKKPPEETPP